MIIDAAVKRLDPALTATRSEVMWSDFRGFGDMLIDRYQDNLVEQVWQYSQECLPALKAAITAILAELEAADP